MRYSEIVVRRSWSAGQRMILALAVFGFVGATGCDSVTAPQAHSYEQALVADETAEETGARDDSGGDGQEQGQESKPGKKKPEQPEDPYRPEKIF